MMPRLLPLILLLGLLASNAVTVEAADISGTLTTGSLSFSGVAPRGRVVLFGVALSGSNCAADGRAELRIIVPAVGRSFSRKELGL